MADSNQTGIQSIFNTQEEVERLILGLTITNGKLYAHIIEKKVNARDTPEYSLVGQTYYAVLQNVDHLIDINTEEVILPSDPKQRADKVGELIEKIREANIGKIGQKCATLT